MGQPWRVLTAIRNRGGSTGDVADLQIDPALGAPLLCNNCTHVTVARLPANSGSFVGVALISAQLSSPLLKVPVVDTEQDDNLGIPASNAPMVLAPFAQTQTLRVRTVFRGFRPRRRSCILRILIIQLPFDLGAVFIGRKRA